MEAQARLVGSPRELAQPAPAPPSKQGVTSRQDSKAGEIGKVERIAWQGRCLRDRRALAAVIACAALMWGGRYAKGVEVKNLVVEARNPQPKTLPTLSVWWDESFGADHRLLMLGAEFPDVPGLVCDSWCYESDLDFLGATSSSGGRIELRHRWRQHPNVVLMTMVTPERGAVAFEARVEVDKDAGGELPPQLPAPNMCWQLRRAEGFRSAPAPYPDFVKRCFIFTEKGRTFLDQTTRRKIPCRPPDDAYNNPPWVQMYVGVWQQVPEAGATSWADYSPDRYTTPVIGAVSRDGKYLAALANDSAGMMCQAWHDCMHNNAEWLPAEAAPGERRWRVKVYGMKNDAGALLARVNRDFPNAARRAHQTAGVTD